MRAQNFDVQVLISYLEGSCHSLLEGMELCFYGMTESDLTSDDNIEIDGEIFRCSSCDWWRSVDERCEDGETCNECTEEQK